MDCGIRSFSAGRMAPTRLSDDSHESTSTISVLFIPTPLLRPFCSHRRRKPKVPFEDGMILWLDADDHDADGDHSNRPADGASVVEWHDKSGNGNQLSQDIAAHQPTFHATATGGRPAIRFHGDDFSESANLQRIIYGRPDVSHSPCDAGAGWFSSCRSADSGFEIHVTRPARRSKNVLDSGWAISRAGAGCGWEFTAAMKEKG